MKEAANEARIAALPDAVMLRVSVAELNASGRWEDEGRECWYKGHLYDVIRQRTVSGTTWLYCLDDEGEEQLIHGAVDVTKANQDQPGRQTRISFSICDLLCQTPQWTIAPLQPIDRQYPTYGVHRLSSRYARIVIPPPKASAWLFG